MADALDFRHPNHQSLERSLHAPPAELETYVEDLNANQITHHHQNPHRPWNSRQRHSNGSTSYHSRHSAPALISKRPSAQSDMDNALPSASHVEVVSSGRVYRQLFDAGVQLRKGYDKAKAVRESKGSPVVKTRFGGIPVVHMSRDMVHEGTGILGERQQHWLTGFPNESDIENPVLYKYEQQQRMSDELESESDVHLKEVRDLPDVVVCKKAGSDVISKISRSREERHESALDEMHQELLQVSTELEPRVEKAAHNLLGELDQSDGELSVLLAEIDDADKLLSHTQPELHIIWSDIQDKSANRRLWIKNTTVMLNLLEDERAVRVTEILSKYTDIIKAIAFVAAKADLDKVIDRESQLLNKTILSNRRCYCELNMRLLAADIERERKAHDLFKLRNGEWKKYKVAEALERFKKFMSEPSIVKPPSVAATISNMVEDQKRVHQTRVELLETTREFRPPTATKKSVYMWNDQMAELSSLLTEVNQRYMQQIYNEYEKVCEGCAQKATDMRAELIKCGAVDSSEADRLVNETLIPMIGRQQKIYEANMERIDHEIEAQGAEITEQMELLFKYSQGSSHIWDIHEIGLAQTERALQERLMLSRRDHDLENQQRESQLDIIMDKMRQDANESNLAKNIKKVRESLDVIRQMYERFHKDQLEVVQTYPLMVKEELDEFDLVVRSYFAVDREQPGVADAQKSKLETRNTDQRSLQTVPREMQPNSAADGAVNTEIDVSGAQQEAGNTSARPSQQSPQATQKELEEASRSRYFLDNLTSNPLPGVVGEMLQTNSGTNFYVLCVAPDIEGGDADTDNRSTTVVTPSSSRSAADGAAESSQAFLTEVRPLHKASSTYLDSFAISADYFTELKKCIRLNFVTYMEEWTDQALQRAHSIVAAKSEELNSELELRLHLHAPRARRAELDVHNVRAAELMMHNERVVRHCKGINQTLADLRVNFDKLLTEHQVRFESFQQDVDSMETVVLRSNKSSMLVEQQAAVQKAKEDFMSDIRVSLRTFRRTLDDTLQLMRESNAMFIKSFKLFSDGGNFCPEEIDVFRKNLDKYSHKVDDSEGAIMSELEGIEAKWLKKATQLAVDFEDRFKNHMIDLVFIEKVARWLTNTQVKIKGEVADSNEQAKRLAQHLNDLERKIDACERPNPDKEVVTSHDLKNGLKAIFEAFHSRADYIKCRLDDLSADCADSVTNISKASKVGFMDTAQPAVSSLTLGGSKQKQSAEDPTITIVKSIYKTQKPPAPEAADLPPVAPHKEHRQVAAADESDKQPTGDSRPVTNKSGKTRSTKASRASERRGSSVADAKNRHSSAARRVTRFDRKDKRFQLFPDELPVDTDYYDKAFGDFLGKIRRIVREAHEGLIAAADVFYKQKGTHSITRPYALQPTMESCAETITQKLQSYFSQATDYHNQCLQEFRQQLIRLETLTERIPPLVIEDIESSCHADYESQRSRLEVTFNVRMKHLDTRKHEHKTLLRPTLGHPNHADKMNSLRDSESSRSDLSTQEINEHEVTLKRLGERHSAAFIEEIASAASQLFLLFDDILTVDDVEKGKILPNKYPTNELLRRNMAGEPLFDKIPDTLMPRGAATWEGLPTDEMTVLPPPNLSTAPSRDAKQKSNISASKAKSTSTAKVHTQKTTIGHNSTLKSRDEAYQTYKGSFYKSIGQVEKEKEEQLLDESRWTECWNNSIDKIRSLY